METQLAKKRVVVVGSARGIGLAVAQAFAAEKAHVAFLDRDASVESAAAETAHSNGTTTLSRVVDVTDFAAVKQTAQSIEATWGGVDHVVFAVGIGSGKFGFPYWNVEPSDWPRVFEVNVFGAVHVSHAFQTTLRQQSNGSMLFLSSVAGQIGSQTDPPYSASKAALINFAQCAAKDLAAYGIRVNTICPGMVRTALNRSVWQAWNDQQPEEKRQTYESWTDDKIRKVVPLNRWQEPGDIAAMAVFLASERGRNITGQTINVDGGFVMHW